MAPPSSSTSPTKPIAITDLMPLTSTSSHTYSIHLLDSFCVGTVPNGGFIASAFLHVARTHMSLKRDSKFGECSDPINMHLEYLRRTAAGPAEFVVRDIKLGRRISNLHITLRQLVEGGSSNGEMQDEVEGYVTLTSLAHETGPSHPTDYHASNPTPLPVADLNLLAREGQDENWIRRRPDPYGAFRRAALHCDMYLVRPERRRPGDSLAVADQWVRFRPLDPSVQTPAQFADALKTDADAITKGLPGRWTNDSLGYVVDIFPQLNERFVNAEVEDALLTSSDKISDRDIEDLVRGRRRNTNTTTNQNSESKEVRRTFWYPTLLLNLDVKKSLPPEGVEWLFVRVQAKKIQNGRFDLCVEVWDEGGDLVALSTHASLILDASRNTNRKKSTEQKEKKESKM